VVPWCEEVPAVLDPGSSDPFLGLQVSHPRAVENALSGDVVPHPSSGIAGGNTGSASTRSVRSLAWWPPCRQAVVPTHESCPLRNAVNGAHGVLVVRRREGRIPGDQPHDDLFALKRFLITGHRSIVILAASGPDSRWTLPDFRNGTGSTHFDGIVHFAVNTDRDGGKSRYRAISGRYAEGTVMSEDPSVKHGFAAGTSMGTAVITVTVGIIGFLP
jgi:hypothetical protein